MVISLSKPPSKICCGDCICHMIKCVCCGACNCHMTSFLASLLDYVLWKSGICIMKVWLICSYAVTVYFQGTKCAICPSCSHLHGSQILNGRICFQKEQILSFQINPFIFGWIFCSEKWPRSKKLSLFYKKMEKHGSVSLNIKSLFKSWQNYFQVSLLSKGWFCIHNLMLFYWLSNGFWPKVDGWCISHKWNYCNDDFISSTQSFF